MSALTSPQFIVILLLLAGMAMSFLTGKLTFSASITGGIAGWLIFTGGSYNGLALLATFFFLGTWATSWKKSKKQGLSTIEPHQLKRDAGQVLANAGVAALLGLAAYGFPQSASLIPLMLAATFASATADTLSSELGNVYGKRFYHILTFRKDRRGENGVISLEGTLAGLAGTVIIACIYSLAHGWSRDFVILVIAGTAGNLADSILGATLERKAIIGNNLVNFLNTLLAAAIAYLLHRL